MADRSSRFKSIKSFVAGMSLLATALTFSVPAIAAPAKKVTPTRVSQNVAVLTPAATSPVVPVSEEEQNTIKIYKNSNKAVVNITSVTGGSAEDIYFNVMPHEGTGSGSIISPEGYILTNNHVVENARQLQVTLWNGASLPAQVMGTDPSNDLAVIKIDPPAGLQLSTIPLGDSAQLEVGRKVLAIGNPFGLDRTLTQGIVSSVGRTLKTENGRLIKGIIQTDAAINPGNSGGPLLDVCGNMIGINTAIMSKTGQSSGIGFAIPVNIAKRIIPELISHHQVVRPEIGIQMVQPTDQGLRIVKLDSSGPAAQAGLSGAKESYFRNGPFTFRSVDNASADIITNVDGVTIHNVDDLLSAIEEKKPGQVVTLTVLRQGRLLKVPVKLSTTSPA